MSLADGEATSKCVDSADRYQFVACLLRMRHELRVEHWDAFSNRLVEEVDGPSDGVMDADSMRTPQLHVRTNGPGTYSNIVGIYSRHARDKCMTV